jgi:hypothetical protein
MIIDYDKVNKINFRESELNDKVNLDLVKCFEKLHFKALESKLDYIITGGLSSLIYYNKIYRTLEDIDLLIDSKDILKWFEIFKHGYNFCYEESYAQKPSQRIIDFKNKKIQSLTFLDNEFGTKIEIFNIELSKFIDFYKINRNGFNLRIRKPTSCLKYKMRYKREKDLKDYEFFSKFLIVD